MKKIYTTFHNILEEMELLKSNRKFTFTQVKNVVWELAGDKVTVFDTDCGKIAIQIVMIFNS